MSDHSLDMTRLRELAAWMRESGAEVASIGTDGSLHLKLGPMPSAPAEEPKDTRAEEEKIADARKSLDAALLHEDAFTFAAAEGFPPGFEESH